MSTRTRFSDRNVSPSGTIRTQKRLERPRRDGRRRARAIAPLLAAVLATVAGGCADEVPASTDAESADVDSTAPGAASAPSSPAAATGIPGVTATLVITRQRDLIDRGLINVMTTNESGRDLRIVERQIVTDAFDTSPVAPRTVKVGDGRRVAIQVPYGTAIDCGGEPVEASLAISAQLGDDATERRFDIPLGGTDILDGIRAEQCALASMEAATELTFTDVAVEDGALNAVVRIELVDAAEAFTFGDAGGTILVAARRHDAEPMTLDAATPVVDIPITFTVNRCDPHALAEVTKRYGLDLDVSVDGGDPVAVSLPADDLVDDLEAIVEECRTRTGS